jgi:DNA-binding beta-propeller fold protein YncE
VLIGWAIAVAAFRLMTATADSAGANGLLLVANKGDQTLAIVDPVAGKTIATVPEDGVTGHEVVAVIPVMPKAQRISLSVDDRWVFTADQTKPQLVVIDTATNGVRTRVELPGIGYGTAPTPDGRWLLLALSRMNKLGVIDLAALKLVRTLDVPAAPQEVLVRPDGAVAYVSCDASRQVAVIDLKNWKVEKLIETGPGTDGLAWAEQK